METKLLEVNVILKTIEIIKQGISKNKYIFNSILYQFFIIIFKFYVYTRYLLIITLFT